MELCAHTRVSGSAAMAEAARARLSRRSPRLEPSPMKILSTDISMTSEKLDMMTFLSKNAASPTRLFRRQISLLSLAGLFGLVTLAGCGGDEFGTNETSSVLFSPLGTQVAAPTRVEDPAAPAKDGIQEIQAIVADFEKGTSADGAPASPTMVGLE